MNSAVFIIITVFIALLSFVVLLYDKISLSIFNRTFRKIYYRKINSLVRSKDWRLINNFTFKLDDKNSAHFDHLIFAGKYIYCIVDKYWHGGVSGKENDESWFFYPDKKEKCFIDNPLNVNKTRIEKLSLVTGLDRDIFVGIIIVNNSCTLDEIEVKDKSNLIIKLKKLKKTILNCESSNVGEMNDEQLQKVVYEIYRLRE